MVRQYDGLAVEAMAQGAVDQAQAEGRAELLQARQDRESLAWFHGRWKIAAKLCEGRPLEDLLCVGEVLAALDGQMPTTLPLTMAWDGLVAGPDGDGPGESTLIGCTTARGGRAVLALDDDQRLQLGEKLLATLTAAETCHTPGCGEPNLSPDEADHPAMTGWISVEVAGLKNGPRWWCNAWCANAAITAAGADLAAVDQAAAIDPEEPVPAVPTADTMALPAIVEASQDAKDQRDEAGWLPRGGHDNLCAYATGMSTVCTCASDELADEAGTGGAL
jgi:hypothetical protein